MTYYQSIELGSARQRPGPVRHLYATLARGRQIARARRALAQLTPDQLRDIGVTQTEARAEVPRMFWSVADTRPWFW